MFNTTKTRAMKHAFSLFAVLPASLRWGAGGGSCRSGWRGWGPPPRGWCRCRWGGWSPQGSCQTGQKPEDPRRDRDDRKDDRQDARQAEIVFALSFFCHKLPPVLLSKRPFLCDHYTTAPFAYQYGKIILCIYFLRRIWKIGRKSGVKTFYIIFFMW